MSGSDNPDKTAARPPVGQSYTPPTPHEAPAAPGTGQLVNHRGARILVVEDNPVNGEVVSLLLEEAGLSAELAENGARAVDLVRQGGYDLILMDVQMPKMDGLEATRQIRRLPGGNRVPILAMTANAFQEDRDRCLAAGMDEYLTKPLAPASLYATLARWLGSAPRTTPAPQPGASGLEGIEGLEVEKGLKSIRGRLASYVRLLGHFAEAHDGDMQLLRTCLDQGRTEEARRLAHSIKGAAATLGATTLSTRAAALEGAIRDAAPQEEIERLRRDAERGLQGLIARLRERLAPPEQ